MDTSKRCDFHQMSSYAGSSCMSYRKDSIGSDIMDFWQKASVKKILSDFGQWLKQTNQTKARIVKRAQKILARLSLLHVPTVTALYGVSMMLRL